MSQESETPLDYSTEKTPLQQTDDESYDYEVNKLRNAEVVAIK